MAGGGFGGVVSGVGCWIFLWLLLCMLLGAFLLVRAWEYTFVGSCFFNPWQVLQRDDQQSGQTDAWLGFLLGLRWCLGRMRSRGLLACWYVVGAAGAKSVGCGGVSVTGSLTYAFCRVAHACVLGSHMHAFSHTSYHQRKLGSRYGQIGL